MAAVIAVPDCNVDHASRRDCNIIVFHRVTSYPIVNFTS
jgi:hypothetical protein